MEEIEHFNRMASELSIEERAKLLERLSSQSSMASSILYEEPRDERGFASGNNFQRLPWYYRLWFFFISFFYSRPVTKIFEEHVMSHLYQELEERYPGFYHFQKDMLLPKLYEELLKLKEGSRFFFNALDASLNRDRGGLMVFLSSLEMPELYKQIVADTDPGALTSQYQDMNEVELRQKAVKILENDLAGMTDEERNKMYHSAQSLHCLKQLSSFLFDRLINSFIYDSSSHGYICPAASARDQLSALNDILSSLKKPPPVSLLSSLFVYVLMEKDDKAAGIDIQGEMNNLQIQADVSLQMIQDFNQEVPLTKLLRCITRNTSLTPRNIGGGEDWFRILRERWKFQVEENFLAFTRTRRQRDVQNSFQNFLKGTELRMLENMGSDQNPLGIDFRGSFCLSFLLTFYSVVFMSELNRYLRPILIDGEFIKKENRAEFTTSYNTLMKLEDVINRFDQNISPEGDYGKRYAQAKNDMSSLPIKRHKIQIVVKEAARDAERIIDQTRESLEGIIKILGGILKKTPDNKYDGLSNLSFFTAKDVSFQDGITDSITQLQKTLQLLEDISVLEAGK